MLTKKLSTSTIIKGSLSIILFMTILAPTIAQQPLFSKYFLNEASGINKMNPAFVPEYGYFSFPALGGFGIGASSTSGLSDFLYPSPTSDKLVTFMNKSVNANDFLSKLSPNTSFDQSMHVDLFSFGFFTKRNSFWSFNVGYREGFALNLPYDFFAMAKKGMSSSSTVYDLKNIRLEQNNIADVSLGYSRKIGSKVRFGLNAKLLVGLAASKIKYDKFDVLFDQNQFKVDATGDAVLISDAISFPTDANGNFKFGDYDLNTSKMKPAGYGAAVDLGFTYNPIKRLTLSASVNDLGSLTWKSTAIKHGVAASGVTFAGFNNVDANNVDVQAQIDQLKEDAKGLIQFKETPVTESYKYDLPTVTRVGAELSLFNNPHHDISLGVLYQNFRTSLKSNDEVVGAVNIRPLSWLMVSGTAAMLTKDYNRYGLAVSFSPCWFNFFIASDFVVPNVNKQFVPIDKFNLNLETGFSIPIGHSRRKAPKVAPIVPTVPQPVVPVQVIDSSLLKVKKDSVVTPIAQDSLVLPPVDSVAMAKADSIALKREADSLLILKKADSIAALPVVLPSPTIVPEAVTTEVVVAQKPIGVATKPKVIVAKSTKGKATLKSKGAKSSAKRSVPKK